MNRVSPETALTDILALMQRDGYVLMEGALSGPQVTALSEAYDRQLAAHAVEEGAHRVIVPRVIEREPVFEALMDLRTTFPVARVAIGADIELASSGEMLHRPPRTPAWIGWHNEWQWMTNVPYPRQNYWVQCTYFISEVTEEMGPFTLLPGTHRAPHSCPWEEYNENGQPREIEGMVRVTGPAGSCLISNTEIWHTNTPNRSDRARRLITLHYKHAWMKQWQEGHETTPEFAARQTDPIRRQLCGCLPWHHDESHFPARFLTAAAG